VTVVTSGAVVVGMPLLIIEPLDEGILPSFMLTFFALFLTTFSTIDHKIRKWHSFLKLSRYMRILVIGAYYINMPAPPRVLTTVKPLTVMK